MVSTAVVLLLFILHLGGMIRGPVVPLVVHHQLFGLADIEFQVIVVATLDKTLCQASVLLLVVIVDASNNGGIVGKLLEVAVTRVAMKV